MKRVGWRGRWTTGRSRGKSHDWLAQALVAFVPVCHLAISAAITDRLAPTAHFEVIWAIRGQSTLDYHIPGGGDHPQKQKVASLVPHGQ